MSTTIRHPFTFVPFPKVLAREQWPAAGPRGHERLLRGSVSGAFDCKLSAVTPLCVKDRFRAVREAGAAPFVPGSSLKGMLRNTLQILGYGCAGQQFRNRTARTEEEEGKTLPLNLEDMTPCTEDAACLVCRLFGYGVEKAGNGDDEPFGWSSKVRFFDSEPAENWNGKRWGNMADLAHGVAGRQPAKPQDKGAHHKAFYFPHGDGRPAGWKIYRHATKVTKVAADYASDDCVKPGTAFRFRVEFENLTAEEFAVFEFALTLSHKCAAHPGMETNLAHKLGFGKGVGMGSCRVEITGREAAATRRYFGGAAAVPPVTECGLGSLPESAAFRAFRDARDMAGKDVMLLFPSWQEFNSRSAWSIDQFDTEFAKAGFRILRPEQAAPQQAVVKPPAEPLPAVVRGTVISNKNNVIKGETAELFNGSKYRFEVVANGYANKGDEIGVTVDAKSVNHDLHSFRAKGWTR